MAGLLLALAGYAAVFHFATAHHSSLIHSNTPELAWLKEEFHLSDPEFARVCQLHDQYLDGCAERCRQIDAKNQELARLLASTNTVTPQIEQLLNQAAQLRADCQKAMLQHFYEISRTMPPDQARRYLTWIQQQTVLADSHGSMHR
jgi:hypothetical protein